MGPLQGHVVLVHTAANRQLVLEANVGKIVGPDLKECYLAAFFKVVEEVLFGDFAGNVPHDDRVVGLEKCRLIGAHYEQPLATIILLIPQKQQPHVGFVARLNERGDGPLGALLLPQEVHLLDRGKLLEVRRQVLLRARRSNVLHVEQMLSVHGFPLLIQRQTFSLHSNCTANWWIRCRSGTG